MPPDPSLGVTFSDAEWQQAARVSLAASRWRAQAASGNAAVDPADVLAAPHPASALRRLRAHRYSRLVGEIAAGRLDVPATLAALSGFADEAVGLALQIAEPELARRHGTPVDDDGRPARPVILGMGKLGGRELNFSSDIDLIFLHTANGTTNGAEPIENETFFVKLAQQVGKLLSEQTAEGFVFRVDTLLRPFGSAGPMSMSIDAAEEYYQTHGREWERYAMIKARPIAGDLEAGDAFLDRLRPFVYRRYLDFNAINSLRDLKRRIHGDVVARRVIDDVKLSPGGIRELEFIVQSFQLVRGGQDARLRQPSLRPTLAYLGECGLLPPATAQKLDACYLFLRQLENGIQMYDDRQTHRLPVDEEARAALCIVMDLPDWHTLRARYEDVAACVNEEFQRVFAEPHRASTEPPTADLVRLAFDGNSTAAALAESLVTQGFDGQPDALAQRLLDLARGRLARGLSETAATTLRRMLCRVLHECLGTHEPTRTAERVLAVVQSISGRSTYLTLLDESATARTQLVKLCAASKWVSEQIAASPATLDTLLDPRTLYEPPSLDAMRQELDGRLSQISADDVEAGMDTLRRYRNEITVRTAAADVGGTLPLVRVSDQLTWLAEAVLAAALRRARMELSTQYGEVFLDDGTPADLAAVAYGKFGGIELGYGSDLDLVFIHDAVPIDAESRGGARALPAPAWFARLAQRVIHWLSTLTPAGRAYEVDLELRPSGQSGAVVVSLQAFERYQREQAWTWEHQALTRARFVAGPDRLAQAFGRIRRDVLCRQRDPARLATEITEMREKMRRHLEKRREGAWDLKQGRGGVIDCEFLTQFLLLRDAAKHPELVRWSDNWRQLDDLADAGSLSADDKERLIGSYRAYRAAAHAKALQSEEPLAPADALTDERRVVVDLWERFLPH